MYSSLVDSDEDVSWDPNKPEERTGTWNPDWSIASKLVLNQEVMCEKFHLTSKPYWCAACTVSPT